MRKILLGLLAIVGLLILVVVITLISVREPIPTGTAGPEAEALTDKIEAAVNLPAWQNTAAIEFTFTLQGTRHLRDMKRDFVRVEWQKGENKYRVLWDRKTGATLAFQDGQPVHGPEASRLQVDAEKRHTNDIYWLNPLATLRAPGAERFKVGERALLLQFKSGGVTPGDSYLFVTDESGLPQSMRFWVGLFPISLFKGMENSFENWITTSTGAKLALVHKNFLKSVDLEDVKAYAVYPVDGTTDEFAALAARRTDSQ